jgi:RNA polymerase sigma-70 factor (ECF subfamily)
MDPSRLTELIEASRKNDHNAFRALVEQFQKMIFGLCFRMLCNEEDARDAVQETFIRAWMKMDQFDIKRDFRTWLYSIASHLCLDQLKSAKTQRTMSLENIVPEFLGREHPEQDLINRDLREVIGSLTEGLSAKQKLVFVLRNLEGLEVPEVSRVTGMNPAIIKSNLFLARQFMRNKLNHL